MARHARSLRVIRNPSRRQSAQAERLVLAIAGTAICILGLIIAAGGLLSPVTGSPFFVLAGVGLMISGALVARRIRAATVPYTLVFAGTLLWSLRNSDLGGSPLAVRLAGPAVLLFILALLMPLLRRWRPRQTIRAFAIGLAGIIAIGIASTDGGPLAAQTLAVTHFLDSQAKGVLQ